MIVLLALIWYTHVMYSSSGEKSRAYNACLNIKDTFTYLGAIGLTGLAVPIAAPATASAGESQATTNNPLVRTQLTRPYSEFTPQVGPKRQGIMLVVHGGGWSPLATGPNAVRAPYLLERAREFQEAGWATWNIDYRPGADGILDVTNFYKAALKRAKGKGVGAYGVSAGAYEAVQLATQEEGVNCVIAEGGPFDLTKLEGQARRFALDAFTPGLTGDIVERILWKKSPARNAQNIKAKLLLANNQADPLIPTEQAYAMKRNGARHVDVDELPPGNEPFVHGGVDAEALKKFRRKTRRWLNNPDKCLERPSGKRLVRKQHR